MDNSFPQQGSDTQQRRGFPAIPHILDRIENWLKHLVEMGQLTEEEQNDAGIHLTQWTDEDLEDRR